MNFHQELGLQSFCFRGFKENQRVAELLKQCGVSVIELCAVHVDFNDERGSAAALETYQRNGVRIAAIGVEGFANDPRAERKRFEFAKRAGARVITCDFRVDTIPKSLRTAERMADAYDIRLAIHNHGGQHWLGNATMLRHLLKQTSKRIGLCLDSAWAMDAGEDPVTMADEFGERLYGLHIKDCVFDRAGGYKDTILGDGNLDLKKFMATLKKVKFNGSLIVEHEGHVKNPVPALTKCVAGVRRLIPRL